MVPSDPFTPLREQLNYYRAQAGEYDQWWLRQGRYDHDEALNALWFAEAAEVSSALSAFQPVGLVLELACGTGIWSEQLLLSAWHLAALDGSPEMLTINAARLQQSTRVRYIHADIFAWRREEKFDVVFFGFWLAMCRRSVSLRFGSS
jgi:ubiquinone/menaquinone biosynthesis C-methylase UbiE